jgi:hypothetical protein
MPHPTSPRTALAYLILAAAAVGCSEDKTPAGPNPGAGVNNYLVGVSAWPAQESDLEPAPDGTPAIESVEIVDSVRNVSPTGNVGFDLNVEYICSEQRYSIRQNPQKIVMFSPDRDILFAGSLLQGKSHREGSGAPGSLLSLPISERAPIQVSIPGLPTGGNFRNVDVVTQANVESAIGAIIGDAQAANLFTPATDDFEVQTYNSEREFALKTGLSGRYLGFSGSASAGVNTRTSETTIAVRYIQRLYEVVVATPQTPGALFTGDFTQAKLQEQVDLGRIGPDNQPVYISNVVYGRMMMFTMTAQASAEELTAIVNASYDGLVGGASASLDARQEQILSSSRIAITTYGGDRNGTQSMIRSGDWREYFTQTVRLSDALPLSYTFRTLTGQIAGVSESTNYTIKTCQPLEDTPFAYLGGQLIGAPVPTPFARQLADVTGDGRMDLILNHLSPTRNVVAVLAGQANGSFGTPVVSEHSAAPAGGWADFKFVVGDVTGEGRADIVWSRQNTVEGNLNYVALSGSDGALTYLSPQSFGSSSWSPAYRVFLADIDGDSDKDLVWNFVGSPNFVWRALSNGDGTFAAALNSTHPNSGWGSYLTFVGDVDRDGDEDLIWNSGANETNRFYHGIFGTAGALSFPNPGRDHPTNCCWANYKRIVGDFDGDQRADIALFASDAGNRGLHRAYSNGVNSFTFPAFAVNATWRERVPNANWEPYAGDVNGDGVDDVILNVLGTTNRVRVANGTINRTFPEPYIQPDHPASAQWLSAGNRGMLVGDVNGDGRADVVWVVPSANSEVYVGLGRP